MPKALEIGMIITGKLIGSDSKHFFVDVGTKMDACLPKEEIMTEPKMGDVLTLYVMEKHPNNIIVSAKKAEEIQKKRELQKAFQQKKQVEGQIVQKISDGYIVMLDGNIKAFLPSTEDLNGTVKVYIVKYNNGKKIILDKEKAVAPAVGTEIEVVEKADNGIFKVLYCPELYRYAVSFSPVDKKTTIAYADSTNLILGDAIDKPMPFKVGEDYEATVVHITDNRLLVTIKGYLTYLTKHKVISNKSSIHFTSLFNLGDKIMCRVNDINNEDLDIQLSKKLEAHDYLGAFSVGKLCKAKVLMDAKPLDKFIFVRLDNLIDALLHRNEMDYNTAKALEKFHNLKRNQVIDVKISSCDIVNEKISCSAKDIGPNSFIEDCKNLFIGQTYEPIIQKVHMAGVQVNLNGLNGFIYRNELRNLDDIVPGKSITAILSVIDYSKHNLLFVLKDNKHHNMNDSFIDLL